MMARYISAHLGRFHSIDPVGGVAELPQSWNRYAYVLGNPLRYIDPFGLAATCIQRDDITCHESIEVIDEDPGEDSPRGSFDPFTGVEGLESLREGGALLRDLQNLNTRPHLPASMHGMWFRQGLAAAMAAGAGGDCPSDPNCVMLAEAATALEHPLYQNISTAQQVGLMFVFGGSAAGEAGSAAGRTAAAQGQAVARTGDLRLFGKGGALNSNRYLRVGYGRLGGQRVFRVGGEWVQKTTGRPHIDLWKGGPL